MAATMHASLACGRTASIATPPCGRNGFLTLTNHCVVAVVTVVMFAFLLTPPSDGAPVGTYLRGVNMTTANLTGVITTITNLYDDIACSFQCKTSRQCGGFSINETGCILYTAGVTYTDAVTVAVGYFPA